MIQRIKTLASLAAITAGLAFSSAAPAAETGQVFKDWRVACEKPEGADADVCHIFQNLTMKENGQQILNVMVGYLPSKPEPVMILTLPLGIALPPGVQVQVDEGKTGRAPIETCTPQGCRVGIPLVDEFLTSLKMGNTLNVTFANLQRKGLSVPVSLSGFSAGMSALKK